MVMSHGEVALTVPAGVQRGKMRRHMLLPLPQFPTVGLGEVEMVWFVGGEGGDVDGEGNGVDVLDVILYFVQVNAHLTDREAQIIEIRVRSAN